MAAAIAVTELCSVMTRSRGGTRHKLTSYLAVTIPTSNMPAPLGWNNC